MLKIAETGAAELLLDRARARGAHAPEAVGARRREWKAGERDELLAAVHGRRKQATARREALLRVGRPAWEFLAVLTHRCPNGRWDEPCATLYDLLQTHGEGALNAAFARCVTDRRYTVADVADVLQQKEAA